MAIVFSSPLVSFCFFPFQSTAEWSTSNRFILSLNRK
ncbi:hypothetical protein SAMD00023520_02243 [Listeria monocytogenes]|nr:hypothetical protein SAMD00023520_02243 [Listeria monocytogenes]